MPDTSATDLIYLRDATIAEFDASVVAVDPETRDIALDRTAFYAGGGGQPCDVAWHRLGGDAPLPDVGSAVHGSLNWDDRYHLMRTHTAMHVLCGTIFRDYGALVTGGNMALDGARMDFEMDSADFTPERVAEIERHVNAEIAAGHDVRVNTLPREEAFQIPDLIRTKINLLPEGITEIRTVEIVGLDLQADGGTHVANTREVGGIRIVGTRSKGKANKRLEIVLIDPA